MPNHVTNQLVIYSDEEGEVQRILEEIKTVTDEEYRPLDFEKIIPHPDNLFTGNLGLNEREQCAREGRPNWYDWQIENWGTKWNAYDISVEDDGYGQVTITFDTAWTAPLPIIDALREKYPNAHFYGSWLEEGHQSAGVF